MTVKQGLRTNPGVQLLHLHQVIVCYVGRLSLFQQAVRWLKCLRLVPEDRCLTSVPEHTEENIALVPLARPPSPLLTITAGGTEPSRPLSRGSCEDPFADRNSSVDP